jgi:hypothetical protein
MKIYIDESGSFGWGSNPGISLFCGVTIADRNADALFARFRAWRQTIRNGLSKSSRKPIKIPNTFRQRNQAAKFPRKYAVIGA